MSILKILIYPNKKLRRKTKKIKRFDNKLKYTVSNMFKTMYHYKGIGLAAIQININKSIIIIDTTEKQNNGLLLINPKIIKKSGFIKTKEGCLSIPNFFYYIKRFNYLYLLAKDINGNNIKLETKGLLSVCIQHEIDHIKGKLFIDYI